jgi:nucleotide-binding universal stress UspA family protein
MRAPRATVLVVWQPAASLPSLAWGSGVAGVDVAALDEAGEEAARRLADEGVELAREAGLEAESAVDRAEGPVWASIVAFAERQDVSAIVIGTRGLTGMKSVLLGSVSEGVARHSHRPTLVIAPQA